MYKKIYLSPPDMCGEELEFVKKAFASNWIAPTGPDIEAFEKEICKYTGAKYAVALSSGTSAIHLALLVSGIKSGDEVICSTFTFAGSVFPIMYVGATPIFIDSDKTSWNMDPSLLEQSIKDRIKKGKKPKACIIVHLYGISANLEPIIEICKKFEIILIEDAAESLGSLYNGRYTGTIAPFGIFSFNGNKIITTSGGGMLIGSNKTLIEKARLLSTQARDKVPHYEHSNIGYNYRMSNILASIGRGELSVLDRRIEQKKEIYTFYYNELKSIAGISFMPKPNFSNSNYWLSCISIDQKISGCTPDEIRLHLEKSNIESRPLWKPMHLQPIFRRCPIYNRKISEGLFNSGLCLPSGTGLSKEDLNLIVSSIKSITNLKSKKKCHIDFE